MYRRRLNIDIFIAGGTALLGGAAYVAKVPGPVQVVLGIALFFAPGYLWSEAILSHRLPALERVLTSAGLTLILPIIGGFLFYALRIPLFKGDWVGMLVVLTLLGVVAVAVQRLRGVPDDLEQQEEPRRGGEPPRLWLSPMNLSVYGLAGLVAVGAVGFSVKNAEAQKEPGYSTLSMTQVPGNATKGDLYVANYQGKSEQYQLMLLQTKGKVTKTLKSWTFTLGNGDSWDQKIAYTAAMDTPVLTANLYLLPDKIKVYRTANNGESTK